MTLHVSEVDDGKFQAMLYTLLKIERRPFKDGRPLIKKNIVPI